MNYKAKLLSIWWIFVLAVSGVGIVAGVFIFYSAELDVRGTEASILNQKLFDCLAPQGVLISDFVKDSGINPDFDVFKTCMLSEKAFNDENFYFGINFQGKKIEKGKISYNQDCEAIGLNPKIKDAEGYPKCVKNMREVSFSGKKFELEILTASNNRGNKNAK